jgi:hypothetical protein
LRRSTRPVSFFVILPNRLWLNCDRRGFCTGNFAAISLVPPEEKSMRRVAAPLAFFALAAILLTWPLAISLDEATSVRGDYFSNLWNFWWMKKSLLELNESPYWTDFLQFPMGISLSRHTMSPVNSIPGGLLLDLSGPHAAFNLLLLLHFALSGWTFFLLARYLTGSTMGSILAGLIYSFCPFHYYYLAQLNVATLEFLPLAVLFLLKTYREGGKTNTMLAALFIGLLAASSYYYLIYAFLFGLILLAGVKLLYRETPYLTGVRRLAPACTLGAILVLLVAWPLVTSLMTETPETGAGESTAHLQEERANDLLGFNYVGPYEELIISWPTMLGYSTLLLLALGWREIGKQRFWLLAGGIFLVLSLGTTLRINGSDTGIVLPLKFLSGLPLLDMLRKSDRAFIMIQLVAALLAAFAWKSVSARFSSRKLENACWCAAAVIVMIELSCVPLKRFSYDCPPYLAGLSRSSDAESLLHIPPAPGTSIEGRYNFYQIFHEKKIPQGYTTNLALTQEHIESTGQWLILFKLLCQGKPLPLLSRAKLQRIDLLVVHKIGLIDRELMIPKGATLWQPFFCVRREFVGIRQAGWMRDEPISPQVIRKQKNALKRAVGDPIHEDSDIIVFRL